MAIWKFPFCIHTNLRDWRLTISHSFLCFTYSSPRVNNKVEGMIFGREFGAIFLLFTNFYVHWTFILGLNLYWKPNRIYLSQSHLIFSKVLIFFLFVALELFDEILGLNFLLKSNIVGSIWTNFSHIKHVKIDDLWYLWVLWTLILWIRW